MEVGGWEEGVKHGRTHEGVRGITQSDGRDRGITQSDGRASYMYLYPRLGKLNWHIKGLFQELYTYNNYTVT